MLRRLLLSFVCGVVLIVAVVASTQQPAAGPKIPELKFNEVAEIAPGVFFRYSSISATDKNIPFGGSNHTWIVCKDHVVVIDANFPKEAGDVVEAIKKTTKLPIRYVLDTHHHGDHAYGNCIWAKEGAKIIAHKNAARLLLNNGQKAWEMEAKGREDLRKNELKQADITFDDKYVLDDGTQRIEFYQFGHSHTPGDAVAYLPKHKILCTGDACVNGAFNFMGHSNSASWIASLTKMQKLEVDIICPGHGKVTTKDLLVKQKRYFEDMRKHVQAGLADKKSLADITSSLEMPWYKEWTGKDAKEIKDNVKHVYDELQGKVEWDKLGLSPAPLDWRPAVTVTVER